VRNDAGPDNSKEMTAMTDDRIDYDKISQRVEKRLRQRKGFQGLVLGFPIMSAVLWTVYLMSDRGDPFVWPLIPTAVVGIVVIWQALETYVLTEGRERERDRLMQRELERERERLYGDAAFEKPKRDQAVRLSDDGELIYEDEETSEPRRSAKGRR
jgi:hypothetical protein